MSGFHIQNINMLYLLWVLPVIAGLFIYASYKRRSAINAFVNAGIIDKLKITASSIRRRWKAVLIIMAIAFTIFALTRPGWNPVSRVVHRRGRDVVFLLDVSKSMLAEDLAPNRLERAKLAIRDCVETLRGDRVALVAFAGTSSVKCPLTLDYGFFRMMLDQVGTDSVTRGGTIIGDAVRRTIAEVFDDQDKMFKDIILITDGEDHESFPVEAAKKAGEEGIRILAIGLGDEKEGQRVPITDENGNKTFITYKGSEIWSQLNSKTLYEMATATPGGRYLNVATGDFDLGRIYSELVATAKKKELESETMKSYEEKFQIFLGIAFLLLCLETAMSERKRS